MRPKLRVLLASWAALWLVPAMLIIAAGPAATGSGVAGSLVRAPQADPGTGTELPADPLEPDAVQDNSQTFAGWADVAKQGVKLRYVTASFKVPSVGCGTTAGPHAAFWVGIDGFSTASTPVTPNKTVEQVGVQVACELSGNNEVLPHFSSFWQMAPNASHPVADVGPGDNITVSVYFNDNTNEYNLVLKDSSRTSANINTTQPCPSGSTCHNATAEVIAEDPNNGPANGFLLANFGTVSFTGAQVTSRDGTQGALQSNNLWNANHIHMEFQGNCMANTSGRTNSYHDFHIDWCGFG